MGNLVTQYEDDHQSIEVLNKQQEEVLDCIYDESKQQNISLTSDVTTDYKILQEESYLEIVKRNYQHYFDMFKGGAHGPVGNKSYEEYLQWRYWKQEYERLIV